jgi:uncharacterized caspase-like protein
MFVRALQRVRALAVAAALLALYGLTVPALAAAHRVALVIGNDTYQHAEPLRNARADARAVAVSLQAIGFKVTLKQDVTLQQMKEALRNFKASVSGGDEVVFYFSGHGVQFGGTNYLIPVDLVPESEDQVVDDSVGLQRVLDDMNDQRARFALAIIDACRDNPFKGTSRAIAKRGLAAQAASGQMVLYSAGAGQEALDRLGSRDTDPNGLFTRILIKEIRKPGVTANQLLKNVSYQVVQLAKSVNHDQVPALYDQTIGDYYFVPTGSVAAPVTAARAVNAPDLVHVQSSDELEQEYWNRIKDSSDPADFSDYAKQFPQGAHAAEASLALRKLKRAAHKSMNPVAQPDAVPGAEGRTAALPVAAPQAVATSAAGPAAGGVGFSAGTYAGYSTSSLQPGEVLRGKIVFAANGDFEYTGTTGVKVRGNLDFSRPDNVRGKATVMQPRLLGIPVIRYPDGSTSASMSIRAQMVNGKLHGQFTDAFESGELVVDFTDPL